MCHDIEQEVEQQHLRIDPIANVEWNVTPIWVILQGIEIDDREQPWSQSITHQKNEPFEQNQFFYRAQCISRVFYPDKKNLLGTVVSVWIK